MNQSLKRLAYPYLLWIFIMIVVPFFLVFLYSITSNKGGSSATFKFTLDHYIAFFSSTNFNILSKSILLAVQTTVLCLLFGFPVAWIISKIHIRMQNVLILFFILPMWINMLLRTYAWQIILGRSGILNYLFSLIGVTFNGILYTDAAVLIGMVYNFIPFMVLPIYTTLIKIDDDLIEAASDLGASTKEIFLKIIFPLSIPGVVTGIIMVFLPAVSSFAIPRLLGGGDYILIGNLIEKQFFLLGNWNFGSAISVILMIIIILSMKFMKKSDEYKSKGGGTLPW
ncbi:ABC transporter permease [Mycoplasmatota bacterium]|nr:ABC transporter permease [Mycoplasmatota bacterium]